MRKKKNGQKNIMKIKKKKKCNAFKIKFYYDIYIIMKKRCIHNRNKYACKECGGTTFCKHNKQKFNCKECNPESLCIHKKQKASCKECGGSSVCIHDKQKAFCKECDGSALCIHDKQKSQCKDCNESERCEHNKIRLTCKECGNQFCEHKKIKSRCRDCDGSSFCEHDKRKTECKDCGGSRICEHDKRKDLCIYCNPKIACNNCKHMIMSGNKIYKPYCFKCYCVLNPDIEIKRRYKTKENLLAEALKQMNLGIDFIQDKPVQGGCSKRRPDFLFDLFTHTVIVECDENGHSGYDTTCEIDKLNATFTDLADRPMILIRFNPDRCKENKKSCFDKEGRLIKNEWERRIKLLKKEVKKAIRNIPDELMNIIYLF